MKPANDINIYHLKTDLLPWYMKILVVALQELYGYTFAVGNVDPPFGLYASYPRKEIPAQDCSVQEFDLSSGSLISVECGFGDFDPLIFDKVEPMEVCV